MLPAGNKDPLDFILQGGLVVLVTPSQPGCFRKCLSIWYKLPREGVVHWVKTVIYIEALGRIWKAEGVQQEDGWV